MNLHILALETSSSICGVALLSVTQAGTQLRSLAHDATAEHAERLLPMVDQLLLQAGIERDQLGAVAFGQGPGGFTGLRVACGVAQGMAFALDLPVIPVVSLMAVALRAQGSNASLCVVLQDARMGEVYAAAYESVGTNSPDAAQWRSVHAPILLNANDVGLWLMQQIPQWRDGRKQPLSINVAGDALEAYPALAASLMQCQGGANATDAVEWPGQGVAINIGQPLRADAQAIAQLALQAWQRGETVLPEQAAPLYVRDKVAYTTLERDQGFGGNPKAMVPVLIEPMAQGDLDDVVAIEQSTQSFPWTRGNFSDALQAGYGAWVARQGADILGFCIVMFAPDVAHLLLIAVAPSAQRKGVGYQLLRLSEREAQARGLLTLILEVRPSNQSALDFYRNRGFTQLATRKDYYPKDRDQREDAWVLQKCLPQPGASNDAA